jgi:hypothetical protein
VTDPVRKFNDNTMEYVIALCRGLAILAALYGLVAVLTYAWTGDGRWGLQAVLSAVVAIGVGWLGFFHWGNAEWGRSGDQ